MESLTKVQQRKRKSDHHPNPQRKKKNGKNHQMAKLKKDGVLGQRLIEINRVRNDEETLKKALKI